MALTFGLATVASLTAELSEAGVYTEDEVKALVTDILFEFHSVLWNAVPGCTVDRFTGVVTTSWDNEPLILVACAQALDVAIARVDADYAEDAELARMEHQLSE